MKEVPCRELQVRMLGQLDCTYKGKTLSLIKTPSAKMTNLFLMLLYMAPEPKHKKYILNTLYSDSEADSVNSFKTLLFRLRRALAEELELPEDDCVILRSGMIFLSPRIRIESDVKSFMTLAEAGLKEKDRAKRRNLLQQAVNFYHGDFLPALATDTEVIFENARIQDTFSRVIRTLAADFREEKDYTSMYQVLHQGMRFDPFNEEWICGSIDALTAKGSYRQAMAEYEEKAQMILDEFGAYPSERLLDCLRRADEAMRSSVETRPAGNAVLDDDVITGAYYCSYPAFQGSFHILKRIMSREHLTSTLLLITVVNKDGTPLETKAEISAAVTSLRMAIGRNLRKNDMYTRFSHSQLLVLLWGTPPENVGIVVDRIRTSLKNDYDAGQFDILTEIPEDPQGGRLAARPKIWRTEPRGV